MGVTDQLDQLTFKINFSGGGVARLRDKVKEKLKEFMGDYTDDTLVEYVIVLLRNGRNKGEAMAELNVFLGDDSDSFVSWLWDHLTSNLELYAQPQEPKPDGVSKSISALGNHRNRSEIQHLHSESDGEKSPKVFRSRRKREWKGLVRDAAELPPLRSSEVDNMHVEDKNHHSIVLPRQAHSTRPQFHRKRNRPDERCQAKKEGVSETTTDAPRRLLQFAVRDAVGTSRPSNIATDPKFKRLRSVVSTSVNDSSVDDLPRRVQSIARMPNAAAVIKAVAEAAEDVKYRSAANVFDRMSPSMDEYEGVTEDGFEAAEDQDMRDSNQISMITRSSNYHRRGDHGRGYTRETTMYDSGTGFDFNSGSDSKAYNGVNSPGNDIPQTGPPSGSRVLLKTNNYDHDEPTALANAPRKIVDILSGENTWKPPFYQAPREVAIVNNRQPVQEDHVNKAKSVGHLMRENSNPVTVNNGNEKPATHTRSESQKTLPSIIGSHSSVHPLEDANSRTIFVNNVHFAATKDSISKHFNKFGEVLKVVIVTDATGQPKGSAYVEFMRKEEAEHALSSDSTSFMSRILKVSRKSAAHPEAAPAVTWPRAPRALRSSRASFPRGINGVFRSRPTIKPGARSLQWKRDAQVTPAEAGALVSSNNVPSPTGRGLTYIRIEPKANATGTN